MAFKRNYLLLLAVVLIGLFLRVYQLGTENIWMDEAFSVSISQLSLPQIAQSTAGDAHPPLYYFILHYWIGVFGSSEFAVRFLSVVFGVLAIPVTFVVGRQLFDEEVGLLGALILSLSGFNIQYSQEARMYSLMLLLALVSMYFFLRLLRESDNVAISVGYVIVTTLSLYIHYYGFFVLLAQNIYLVALLLLAQEKTVRLKQWIVLQAIVAGLFAPWIYALLGQISTAEKGFWIPVPTLDTLRDTFIIYTGTVRPSAVFFVLFVLFSFILSILAFFKYSKVTGSMDWKAPLDALRDYSWSVHITNLASVTFLVVWLLTLNVIPFAISRFSIPIYVTRYTITASVALYLLFAGGVRNINWRPVKIAVIVIIVIISAVNVQSYYYLGTIHYTKGEPQEAFNSLNSQVKSGDVVIVYPGKGKHISDYYGSEINANITPFPAGSYYYNMSFSYDKIAENIKELQSNVNGHDRVWFVTCTGFGSSTLLREAKNTLNESYEMRSLERYRGYEVVLFERSAKA